MREKPKAGEIYRHFKGRLYEVMCIAVHSETEEELVIYRQETDKEKVFARPLSMFLSEVDFEKYPDTEYRFRFTKVEKKPDLEADNVPAGEEKDGTDILLRFLDADSTEDKLEVLYRIRNELTDDIIDSIAISLDTEIRKGSIVDRYEELKQHLLTTIKYEGSRLRPC